MSGHLESNIEERTGYPAKNFTTEPDIHKVRSKKMLEEHPEIKDFYGYDIRTAWIGIIVTVLQLGIAYYVGKTQSFVLTIGLGFFLGALLTHWLAMVVHETAHDLALPTRVQNKILALIANIPCLVPISMSFHKYHPIHHFKLGVLGVDGDLPLRWEVRLVQNSTFKKALWLLLGLPLYGARSFVLRNIQNKVKINGWEKVCLIIQTIAIIFMWFTLGPWGLLYLFASIYFGMTIHPVAAHFIHEHYLFDPNQETYSYYGVLNWFCFNVGYHVEHHDFEKIPGWRLPEFKKKFAHIYEPMISDKSWTWVLIDFVFNPKISLSSRRVRIK